VSGVLVELRYDGPALVDHKMDVADLAPALLAFGTLCREANRVLNGERASVRVFVKADVRANCVTISFEVVWSLMEAAKNLLQDERVATAKNILEWLGLIGAIGGPTALGLFAFLRLRSRQPTQETRLVEQDGHSLVEVTIHGDNNVVHVAPEVARLSGDPRVVNAARNVLRPVASREGIERATFRVNGEVTADIDKAFAKTIVEAQVPSLVEEQPEPQEIVAHITIYSPVLDPKASVWRFKILGNVQSVDIQDSGIVEDILRRGKVVVGDSWKVRLSVTEKRSKGGGFKPEFKVIEVLGFTAGLEQGELEWPQEDDDADENSNE
jgi:hypothetical protein